mmetsp:Transcript_88192/g.175138  ORF Transcript_88192/g.175138 Transcript_88192/m.175138 type:complete len:592 (+) Transcript_88192:93-1868(+)
MAAAPMRPAVWVLVILLVADGTAVLAESSASAGAFLGKTSDGVVDIDETDILSEILPLLGKKQHGIVERMERIESLVRPTFKALPKNEYGRLGSSAVRYAMHRYFVQRHAWFVKGLEPEGAAWNNSSPVNVLVELQGLPSPMHNIFELRLGSRGLDLHEVAAMATVVENLVHKEAVAHLSHAYRLMEWSSQAPLTQQDALQLLDAYMANLILAQNLGNESLQDQRKLNQQIEEIYPTWPDTQKFVRDVFRKTAPRRDNVTFTEMVHVVEEIGENYGHWQDAECGTLQQDLLELEDRDTGRVRLGDFYSAALHHGKWQFSESTAYLRQLGALDESDPANLRVMIPNYINSHSNCVAASNYYSACCHNLCEAILGRVEQHLAAPEAPAAAVAVAAAQAWQEAGLMQKSQQREEDQRAPPFSPGVLRKLEDVANHYGGQVPLHTRLFAQWLHQAFPRECPYPHVTGTISPFTVHDFESMTGEPVTAPLEEMRQHAEANGAQVSRLARAVDDVAGAAAETNMDEEAGLWTMEEEVFVFHPPAPPNKAPLWGVQGAYQGIAFAAAVVCTAGILIQPVASVVAKGMELQLQGSKYCL